MSDNEPTWSDIVRRRNETIKRLSDRRESVYWNRSLGSATVLTGGFLLWAPSWPVAFGLLVLALTWGYFRTLQHQALLSVLLDEDVADHINNSTDKVLEVQKEVKDFSVRLTAMSNRLGSHTGISLSQNEPPTRSAFTRLKR